VIIKVETLTKTYGRVRAVNRLSLEIAEGSIYGFVGPNGAGKTTTMKILATLLAPTSGQAWVAGTEVTKNPDQVRRHVGYMPDFFGVYDDLKVNEYLDFYASSYGIPAADRRQIADDLLELVDLTHKRDAYVDTLSRGMKQRLCLARSLVHNPDVLLLDEPASGLDPRARVEMRELLKELRQMGKTILISSHILPELAEMCTDIGIVENGELVASGSVAEIMSRVQHQQILEVRLLERAEQAAAFMRALPGIGEAVADEQAVKASYQGDEEGLNLVLTSLISAGFRVCSFARASSNLEDVFLRVTKGVLQ